jgi:hypothetical protein
MIAGKGLKIARKGLNKAAVERRDLTVEGFLAAARQARAGASPQRAMRALLDFGDLTTVERSIWDADLREERRFDNRFYFEHARQL